MTENDPFSIAADYSAKAGNLHTGRGLIGADDPLARAASGVRAALQKARRITESAAEQVAALRADDSLPAEHRARREREITQGADRSAREQIENARSGLTVLDRSVESVHLPKLDRGREQHARDDARMLLSAHPDAGARRAALHDLAGRGDDVAALVAGRWGQDYLQSLGVGDPAAEHAAVRRAAILESARGQLDQVKALRQAVDATGVGVHEVVSGLAESGADAQRDRRLAADSAAIADQARGGDR